MKLQLFMKLCEMSHSSDMSHSSAVTNVKNIAFSVLHVCVLSDYCSVYFNGTRQPRQYRSHTGERRNKVPFSMAIEKVELLLKCFPKHLRVHGNSKNERRQRNISVQAEKCENGKSK